MGRKPDPNKKAHIISTAASVFAHKGYTRTRIIEIAEAAGIGKGTVYEYFNSKEDLFFAVFQSMFEIPFTLLESQRIQQTTSVSDRILMIVEAVIKTGLSRLDQYSLVMEFWSAASAFPSRDRYRDTFRREYAELRKMCADLIRQGTAQGEFDSRVEPEQLAAGLVGTIDALLMQAWLDADFDAIGVSRKFLTVFLKGLRI